MFDMFEKDVRCVSLRDFFKEAADVKIPVDNSKVFLPDRSWSMTFAKGLQAIDFSQSHVLEVGVGSGVNLAGLITCKKPPVSFIGTDLVMDAVSASAELAQGWGWNVRLIQSDLLDNLDGVTLSKITDIIACIPQVPVNANTLQSTRELSDYYPTTGIKEDIYGLGLLARLLDQVQERAPQASVTLNIAERPGKDRVDTLFADRGFNQEVVYQHRVRQDAGTSLASLAKIERETELPFHFYADPISKLEIGAGEAEKLRVQGKPIYHNLAVIRARLG